MVEPPRNATNVTEYFESGQVRGTTVTPLEIVHHSQRPLEYSTKAEKLQLRCSVTVSTTSSISADTVASLGGEGKAKTFIESVTASFAQKFSNELEQELHDACRDNISGENATSYSEEFAVQLSDDNSYGEPTRQVFRKPGHEPNAPEEDDIDDKEGETVNPTRIRRESVIKSSKHLEDYSEADSPTPSPDSLHKDSNAVFDANYHRDIREERLFRPINEDTRRYSEDEHSINSDSGKSNMESDESVRSTVATEDLEVVLQKLDEINNNRGYDRVTVPYDSINRPSVQDHRLPRNRHHRWVLTLRRIFEPDNRTLERTQLEIGSDLILDVLKRIPLGQEAGLESTRLMSWPDDNVFRYREDIKTLALSLGELAVRHVGVLLHLVEEEYGSRIMDIKEMFPKNITNFQILREIFWKGDIIVNKRGTRAYHLIDAYIIVEDTVLGKPPKSFLRIIAEYVDFQGDRFGAVKYRPKIPEFDGVKYIKDLPTFPLKYHPNATKLAQRLVDRGQKFACLSGQRYKIHRGLVPIHELPDDHGQRRYVGEPSLSEDDSSEDDSDDANDNGGSLVENGKPCAQTITRVVVDAAAFNRYERFREIKSRSLNKELVGGVLTEQHLRICTNEVPVFSMRDKFFYKAPVDEIHDIVFNQQAFSQLVVPETTKDLIRALIESHIKGSGMDDFIEGKGKGLVLLLHGPPGVGKTMTAEAVAEHTQRPLYAVTSGELGETSGELERNLRVILDRAKTLNAVLLLDEADVFVEERTPQDLHRNALVSIFLRELEYYQGILILTTNRAQTFDHAIQSRIHLSIQYMELDTQARERIWRAFGDHAAGAIQVSDADYAELAAWQLNGRQIKNVISSSKALASSKGDELSMEYLKVVLNLVGNSQPWV